MSIRGNPIEKIVQMMDNLATFTNVKGTEEIISEFNYLIRDIYDLLMGLNQFNRKKRIALIKLAHLFPESLTTVDLRRIMEYSPNTSLSYIRNEITELEEANLIIINRHITKEKGKKVHRKLPFMISINHKHTKMRLLISLCSYGKEYKELTKSQMGDKVSE
ncbi:MAG: hypothetical protein GF329_13665 [Candidatus Lokiarchaeota archaeon]|nr:hypothetical protein [Candidatus Lokiarchaeota archaeon]